MVGKSGRPKSRKGPTPSIVRTVSIPEDEFKHWQRVRELCKEIGLSMSELIRDKIKKIEVELTKIKNEEILKHDMEASM